MTALDILTLAEQYFQEKIRPCASAIDQDAETLLEALKGMGDRRLLALNVPQQWGGAELDEYTYRCFQILIARYSGTLTFLQTQHQSAGKRLAKSTNESLKQAFLPSMATGASLMAVSHSHLRRRGQPPVTATPTSQGYEINGIVPWITGWTFFDWVILGAILPTGDALYGMIPFQSSEQPSGGKIQLSPPLHLAIMQPCRTVTATLNRWLLTPEYVVMIKSPVTLRQQDCQNVLHQGFYALGCALAGLDILGDILRQNRVSANAKKVYAQLSTEVNLCRERMLLSSNEILYERRLKLRVWAINLAGRCSQAAVMASGGAANLLSHPAQRVYREALMFSVFGQTADIRENTLQSLQYSPFNPILPSHPDSIAQNCDYNDCIEKN